MWVQRKRSPTHVPATEVLATVLSLTLSEVKGSCGTVYTGHCVAAADPGCPHGVQDSALNVTAVTPLACLCLSLLKMKV